MFNTSNIKETDVNLSDKQMDNEKTLKIGW